MGNGNLTPEEERTHFAIWSIMSSPLLAGNNLTAATPELIKILTAKGPLSVNQDSLALQARLCRCAIPPPSHPSSPRPSDSITTVSPRTVLKINSTVTLI